MLNITKPREKIKMDKKKIDRINELGRLSKQRELTEEEKKEQKALREEYIAFFKASIKGEVKNGGK